MRSRAGVYVRLLPCPRQGQHLANNRDRTTDATTAVDSDLSRPLHTKEGMGGTLNGEWENSVLRAHFAGLGAWLRRCKALERSDILPARLQQVLA
eukprot:5325225-Amphidinium_carterae.1